MQRKWICQFLFIFALFFEQVGNCETINIETAWQRILCYAPSIAAADAEVSALEWEARQASLMLNPVFEVESENLGVNHPSDDVEPPQTTFSLAHTLELGGKRSARFALASSFSSTAFWEAQVERENTLFEMNRAFIEVRTAQEKLHLAQEKLAITEKMLEVIKKQAKCGKISPIQEKKTTITLMADRLAAREAASQLQQAKTHLSSMWGCRCPDFDGVDFELYNYTSPPCQTSLLEGFCERPEYKKAQQAVCSATRNITLQKANRIPDLTLIAGYRRFHDSHTGGWVVGAAFPLPIFDRNQGGIGSATCELSQAECHLEEVTRETTEKILLAYEKVTASFEEIDMMYQCVVKEAQEAVELTEKGYQNGKFDYLDYLEAQKMIFEIQEKYLDMLCEYHMNQAELSYLSGQKL